MNGLTHLLSDVDELKSARKKKCNICGEVKFAKDFSKNVHGKHGLNTYCKECDSKQKTRRKNTERGYLLYRYGAINTTKNLRRKSGQNPKCHFTFDEFVAAWEKHKSIYGMKSAWGPGINNLEKHLPITMIIKGEGQIGKKGCLKGSKRILSNLSIDRLDSGRDYTLQNIIFIRDDENKRKNSSSYEDCKIQISLHEERFKNEME